MQTNVNQDFVFDPLSRLQNLNQTQQTTDILGSLLTSDIVTAYPDPAAPSPERTGQAFDEVLQNTLDTTRLDEMPVERDSHTTTPDDPSPSSSWDSSSSDRDSARPWQSTADEESPRVEDKPASTPTQVEQKTQETGETRPVEKNQTEEKTTKVKETALTATTTEQAKVTQVAIKGAAQTLPEQTNATKADNQMIVSPTNNPVAEQTLAPVLQRSANTQASKSNPNLAAHTPTPGKETTTNQVPEQMAHTVTAQAAVSAKSTVTPQTLATNTETALPEKVQASLNLAQGNETTQNAEQVKLATSTNQTVTGTITQQNLTSATPKVETTLDPTSTLADTALLQAQANKSVPTQAASVTVTSTTGVQQTVDATKTAQAVGPQTETPTAAVIDTGSNTQTIAQNLQAMAASATAGASAATTTAPGATGSVAATAPGSISVTGPNAVTSVADISNAPVVDSSGTTSTAGPSATATGTVTRPAPLANQINESIQTAVQNNQRELVVQLNPPQLGRIAIRFQQEGNQLVGVVQVSERQTRADIEQALPQILQNLENNGTQVRRINVELQNEGESNQSNTDSAGRGLSDSQPQDQDRDQPSQAPTRENEGREASPNNDPRDQSKYEPVALHPEGGVDLLL